MKTTETTVSNVCYSDAKFQRDRFDALIKNGILRWYAFIPHDGYVKPSGSAVKWHSHVVIMPAKRIDLESIETELTQIIADKTKLCQENVLSGVDTLGFQKFGWSKTKGDLIDWLAYAVHDTDYLKYKDRYYTAPGTGYGQQKDLAKPYYDLPIATIVTSDAEIIARTWENINACRNKWYSTVKRITNAVESGMSFSEFADRNRLPYAALSAAQKAFTAAQEIFAAQTERMAKQIDATTALLYQQHGAKRGEMQEIVMIDTETGEMICPQQKAKW